MFPGVGCSGRSRKGGKGDGGLYRQAMGVGHLWLLPQHLDDTHSAGSVLHNGPLPSDMRTWGTEEGPLTGLSLSSLSPP